MKLKNIIILLVLPILSYGQATRLTLSQLAQSGAFNNQSVRWDSITSSWKPFTVSSGFTNPMTTLGDIIYGETSGTPARVSGNTASVPQYLYQIGTGTTSAAPYWKQITGTDVNGAALTRTNDTNVTLTLGGTPSTALLRATSLTLGWTGELAVDRGGTGASTAPAARTNLGASTVGSNIFTITNPSAETYLKVNSNNSVSLLSATSYRESLSLVSSGPNVIGHIVQYSSTTNIDTTGLFWNSTTGRLGIGTTTPSRLVDIQGDIAISGVGFGTGKNGLGDNIAIGLNSLVTNTTGFANVAVGKAALRYNTTGDYNTAIGETALTNTTTGDYNLAIGSNALSFNETGSRNISIGAFSGNRGSGHTKSIFIGGDAKSESTLAQTNQIVIGDSLIGLGSNSVILGNYNITKTLLQGNVGIGTTAFSSKLDIKGSGNTASTRPLRISNSLDTTLLFVRDDVKVGIGTTNIDNSISGANLTIGSASGGSVSLRSGATLVGRLQANSTQVELYAPVGSADIVLSTNAEPRFYVKSDGKVGIGTSAPKATLQVAGSFGRNAPTIVTSSTAYTVDSQTNPDNWVIFTAASGTLTLTLPTASNWTGREITFRCSGDLVVNTNTNIYGPNYTLTTTFLSGILRTATLVSDGTYWVVVATN